MSWRINYTSFVSDLAALVGGCRFAILVLRLDDGA